MAGVEAITLEVPDAAAAEEFYAAAFGAGSRLRLRTSDAPTTGFRGFTLSLIVSQPADVDVKASKRFYVERGLPVGKSFGGRYVEFDTVGTGQAVAAGPSGPGQGRRRATGRQRLAPARHRWCRRALHRPRRVRLGARHRGVGGTEE